MLYCSGLPVWGLWGRLHCTHVSSHLPSAFVNAGRRKHMKGKFSAQSLAYVILTVAGVVALTSSFVASASELHFRSSVTGWKLQWGFQKYSGLMLTLSSSNNGFPTVSTETKITLQQTFSFVQKLQKFRLYQIKDVSTRVFVNNEPHSAAIILKWFSL